MKKNNFTLIELLIVVGIIAVLAGLLLPTLSKARGKAYTISCANGMKQLALGFQMYAGDFDDFVPHTQTTTKTLILEPNGFSKQEKPTWRERLSSYVHNVNIGQCFSGKSELQHLGNNWVTNYTANAKLGMNDEAHKKISSCKRAAAAAIIIDGQDKTRYTMSFNRNFSRPEGRHDHRWNILFADGHCSISLERNWAEVFTSNGSGISANAEANLMYNWLDENNKAIW